AGRRPRLLPTTPTNQLRQALRGGTEDVGHRAVSGLGQRVQAGASADQVAEVGDGSCGERFVRLLIGKPRDLPPCTVAKAVGNTEYRSRPRDQRARVVECELGGLAELRLRRPDGCGICGRWVVGGSAGMVTGAPSAHSRAEGLPQAVRCRRDSCRYRRSGDRERFGLRSERVKVDELSCCLLTASAS